MSTANMTPSEKLNFEKHGSSYKIIMQINGNNIKRNTSSPTTSSSTSNYSSNYSSTSYSSSNSFYTSGNVPFRQTAQVWG